LLDELLLLWTIWRCSWKFRSERMAE